MEVTRNVVGEGVGDDVAGGRGVRGKGVIFKRREGDGLTFNGGPYVTQGGEGTVTGRRQDPSPDRDVVSDP